MIKIVFTSDIHLGITEKKNFIPENIREKTFKKIIDIAMDHDLLIIAGDLIDNTDIDEKKLRIIKNEFKKLTNNNTKIILTPGLGELNSKNTVPSSLFNLNATYIFSNPEYSAPFVYSNNDEKLFIYGIPASRNSEILKIQKLKNSGFHMGLFHADFNLSDPIDEKNPFFIEKKHLKKLDLDFYAIGSNHNFKIFKLFDRVIGVCPGSPEAVNEDETGDRYVVSLFIKNNLMTKLRRLSVNSMRIIHTAIDCSNTDSSESIFESLKKNRSQNTIQHVVLTGERKFTISENEINDCKGKFCDLIITDKSYPPFENLIRMYEQEDSTRGEFFNILKELDKSGKIPENIDQNNLSKILSRITNSTCNSMEDLLCDLSDA